MDFSKNCFETEDYAVLEEREDRYICRCNNCGGEFTIWK